jgi:hypothetical protein
MSTDRLMVPLAELARRMQRSDRTLRRWLRRKGIRAEGCGVHLAQLRDRWPAVYEGLRQEVSLVPVCSECGVPARCECVVCGAEVRA